MKKIFLSFAFLFTLSLIIIFTQSGCKKETINNITATDTVFVCTPSINGLWAGTQQNATSGQPFTMSIRPDGTMMYQNVISGIQQICVGTWTLSNSIFTCNTTCIYGLPANIGVTQRFTANFNSSTGNFTLGQWLNTSPPTDSGTFTLTKVN